ncbi:MAG: hypothetical protein J3K34DRAFT_455631 [Monoraphidium minutum]|nr:MAG: hypothetical protein J3K34DRAFT_455631 [Monoraphidium minutum]
MPPPQSGAAPTAACSCAAAPRALHARHPHRLPRPAADEPRRLQVATVPGLLSRAVAALGSTTAATARTAVELIAAVTDDDGAACRAVAEQRSVVPALLRRVGPYRLLLDRRAGQAAASAHCAAPSTAMGASAARRGATPIRFRMSPLKGKGKLLLYAIASLPSATRPLSRTEALAEQGRGAYRRRKPGRDGRRRAAPGFAAALCARATRTDAPGEFRIVLAVTALGDDKSAPGGAVSLLDAGLNAGEVKALVERLEAVLAECLALKGAAAPAAPPPPPGSGNGAELDEPLPCALGLFGYLCCAVPKFLTAAGSALVVLRLAELAGAAYEGLGTGFTEQGGVRAAAADMLAVLIDKHPSALQCLTGDDGAVLPLLADFAAGAGGAPPRTEGILCDLAGTDAMSGAAQAALVAAARRGLERPELDATVAAAAQIYYELCTHDWGAALILEDAALVRATWAWLGRAAWAWLGRAAGTCGGGGGGGNQDVAFGHLLRGFYELLCRDGDRARAAAAIAGERGQAVAALAVVLCAPAAKPRPGGDAVLAAAVLKWKTLAAELLRAALPQLLRGEGAAAWLEHPAPWGGVVAAAPQVLRECGGWLPENGGEFAEEEEDVAHRLLRHVLALLSHLLALRQEPRQGTPDGAVYGLFGPAGAVLCGGGGASGGSGEGESGGGGPGSTPPAFQAFAAAAAAAATAAAAAAAAWDELRAAVAASTLEGLRRAMVAALLEQRCAASGSGSGGGDGSSTAVSAAPDGIPPAPSVGGPQQDLPGPGADAARSFAAAVDWLMAAWEARRPPPTPGAVTALLDGSGWAHACSLAWSPPIGCSALGRRWDGFLRASFAAPPAAMHEAAEYVALLVVAAARRAATQSDPAHPLHQARFAALARLQQTRRRLRVQRTAAGPAAPAAAAAAAAGRTPRNSRRKQWLECACAVCGRTRAGGAELRRCAGCGRVTGVRYCGQACCREDWAPAAPPAAAGAAPRAAPAAARGGASCEYDAAWWPVAFTADLDKEAPQRFTLLSKARPPPRRLQPRGTWAAALGGGACAHPLVIWWDRAAPGGGAWRSFLDACPHRLVPLSEGRVNSDGRLECPYHGGGGRLRGADASNPRACATAYPCAVRQGLLFVRPKTLLEGGAPDEGSIPTVPELEDPGWVSQDTFRDVPYDWSTLMENVLDASHVPFTHHKSISNRAVLGDYVTQLTAPVTASGFAGIWPTGPRAGALGPQSGEFRAPGYMQQKIDMAASRGAESMVIVYAVPSSPGKCRLINRNTFRFLKSPLPGAIMRMVPGWLIHVGTQVPLEDDQIFLHYGEEAYVKARAQGLSVGKAYYMPSQADTYVAAFRRWLDDHGGGGPWGPPDAAYAARLEPRLSREALLDRWAGHTQSCARCRAALLNIRAARGALRAASGALAAAALLAAAVAVCAGAGGAAAAAPGGALGRLATLALAATAWLAGAVPAAGAPAAAAAGGGAMLRALLMGLAALLAWRVSEGVLGGLEEKLLRGSYPPPRNTDKTN